MHRRVSAVQGPAVFVSLRWNGGDDEATRRSARRRPLVLAVALSAAVVAGCGGETEPSGTPPPALERRDAPRAVAAEEQSRQEETETAGDVAGTLMEQIPRPQRRLVYAVPDGEGGIRQVFTGGLAVDSGSCAFRRTSIAARSRCGSL